MEHIQNAKNDLVSSIREKESVDVIKVFQQYYNDLIEFEKIKNNNLNYYLLVLENYEGTENSKVYTFTNRTNLINFINKNNFKNRFKTIIEIKNNNIDPKYINEISTIQLDYNEWLKR